MTVSKTTNLFWGERGDIACADHAPYRGSDTWCFERWKRLSARDKAAMEAELGRPIDCACCEAKRRTARERASR